MEQEKQEATMVSLNSNIIRKIDEYMSESYAFRNREMLIEHAVTLLIEGKESHAESCLEDIINTLRAHGHEVDGE